MNKHESYSFKSTVSCYCNLNWSELRNCQLIWLLQTNAVWAFRLFINCFSEGEQWTFDWCQFSFWSCSTSSVSGLGVLILTEWDYCLAWWSWAPAPGFPHLLSPNRVSALCLSAFLGQSDHSTAAAHSHMEAYCIHICKKVFIRVYADTQIQFLVMSTSVKPMKWFSSREKNSSILMVLLQRPALSSVYTRSMRGQSRTPVLLFIQWQLLRGAWGGGVYWLCD